jgi:hypothetical protein
MKSKSLTEGVMDHDPATAKRMAEQALCQNILQVCAHMHDLVFLYAAEAIANPDCRVVLMMDTGAASASLLKYIGSPPPNMRRDPRAEEFVGKTRLYFATFQDDVCLRGYLYVTKQEPTIQLGVSLVEVLRGANCDAIRTWWAGAKEALSVNKN